MPDIKCKNSLMSQLFGGGVTHQNLFTNPKCSRNAAFLGFKKKEGLNASIRSIFRRATGTKLKIGSKEVLPAVISCRPKEHEEFLQFGPEMCVPDVLRIDVATIRNFCMLFSQSHCYVDIDPTAMRNLVRQAKLAVEEQYLGVDNRLYYAHMEEPIVPPFKQDGTPTHIAIEFITRLLKKFGGSIKAMLSESCKRNPNMTPHIFRQNGAYMCKAMEMTNPKFIKLCDHCGTVNMAWLSDEETQLREHMCGACTFPLDYKSEKPYFKTGFEVMVEDITQILVGAIQLAMSEVTNNLPGAPPLSKGVLQKLIDQDYKNVRAIHSRLMKRHVSVANGMTDYQLKSLEKSCNWAILVTSRGTPNPHAMLAAERKLIWYNFVEKAEKDQFILEIGGSKCYDTNMLSQWHGMAPIMDWRDVERYAGKPQGEAVCRHTAKSCNCLQDKHPLIISIDSMYDIDPADIIDLMDRTKSTHLLYCVSTAAVDFKRTQGVLHFDQGLWCRDGNKLITSLVGDDRPYENSWELTKIWSQADLIRVKDRELSINDIKTIGNHKIRVLTKGTSELFRLRACNVTAQGHQIHTVKVPMLDYEDWISAVGLPKIKVQTIKFDLNLFRALYARNITGGLSFSKLLEYGLGYAHVKYQAKGQVFTHGNVTADDIRTHAVLAIVYSRRKHGWVCDALRLSNPSKNLGVDAIEASKAIITDFTVKAVGLLIQELIGATVSSQDGQHQQLNKLIDEWFSNDTWKELEGIIGDQPDSQVNYVEWPATELPELQPDQSSLCLHHKISCQHKVKGDNLCDCCEMAVASRGSKCDCCYIESCQHQCHHRCGGPTTHLTGTGTLVNCECCGVFHKSADCPICHMKMTKHPDKQQPPVPKKREPVLKDGKPAKNQTAQPPLEKEASKPETQQPVEPTQPVTAEAEEDGWWTRGQATGEHIPTGAPVENEPTSASVTNEIYTQLARMTNLEYASVVYRGLQASVLAGLCEVPSYSPASQIGISELKYIPMGKFVVDSNNYKVVCVNPTKGDGLCGFYALQHVIGGDANLSLLRTKSNKNANFDSDDLSDYLSNCGRNSLILVKDNSLLTRVDAGTNEFVCIKHSSLDDEYVEHWEPCNVQQLEIEGVCPNWYGAFTQKKFDEIITFTDFTSLHIEDEPTKKLYAVVESLKTGIKSQTTTGMLLTWPQLMQANNEWYLSNNTERYHNLSRGLIHLKVPEKYVTRLELLNEENDTVLSHQVFNEGLNLSDPRDMQEEDVLNELVTECIYSLLLIKFTGVKNLPEFKNWNSVIVQSSKTSNNLRKFRLESSKLKTGDIVFVRKTGKNVLCPVVVEMDNIYIENIYPADVAQTAMTITYPRSSTQSLMLRLVALFKPKTKLKALLEKLEGSPVVLGPAGSGKTTMIVKEITQSTIIIARTRMAVINIRNKIPASQQKQVMTLERFLRYEGPIDHLLIDECTMFQWHDLYVALTHVPKTLKMFGDPNQVGSIDAFNLGGSRCILELQDLSKNVHHLKYTYRFGQDLCNLLSPVIGQIESKSPHRTELVEVNLDTWDREAMDRLVKFHQPNVILTHHNRHKHLLTQVKNLSTVDTIHSFQSHERNVVMVVQFGEAERSTLCYDGKYNVSAATRCKTKLVWVSINVPKRLNLQNKICGFDKPVKGGGIEDVERLLAESLDRMNKIRQEQIAEDLQRRIARNEDIHRLQQSIADQSSSIHRYVPLIKKDLVTRADIMQLVNSEARQTTKTQWVKRPFEQWAKMLNDTAERKYAACHINYNTNNVRTTKLGATIVTQFNMQNQTYTYWTEGMSFLLKTMDLHQTVDEGVAMDLEQELRNLPRASAYRIMTERGQAKAKILWEGVAEAPINENQASGSGVDKTHQAEDTDMFFEPEFEPSDELLSKLDIILSPPTDLQLVKIAEKLSGKKLGVRCIQVSSNKRLLVLDHLGAIVVSYGISNYGLTMEVEEGLYKEEVSEWLQQLKQRINSRFINEDGTCRLPTNLTSKQRATITTMLGEERVASDIEMTDTITSASVALEIEKDLQEMHKYLIDAEVPGSEGSDQLEQLCDAFKQKQIVTHTLYSDDNQHYCNEKFEDGAIEDWPRGSIKGAATLNRYSTQLVRALAELAQIEEAGNDALELPLTYGKVVVKSFGGCSLCSGIGFSENHITLLKIWPRRSASTERQIWYNTLYNPGLTNELLQGLCIYHVSPEVSMEVQDATPLESYLPDFMLTLWYEAAMVIERISRGPKFLLELMLNQKDMSNKKTTQFDHAITNWTVECNNFLMGTGWRVATSPHINPHYPPNWLKTCITNGIIKRQLYKSEVGWCTTSRQVATTKDCRLMTSEEMTKLVLTDRVKKWQYAVARWTAKTFSHEQTEIGNDPEFESGLNLGFDYHMNNNTEVFRLWQAKQEEKQIINMKKAYHVLFIAPEQLDNYKWVLSRDCRRMPIETHGLDTIEKGFDLLVEQVHLKYYYNGLDKHDTMTMLTDYPYLSILNSAWACLCQPPTIDSKHRYEKNIIDCPSMLKKLEHVYKQEEETQGEKKPEPQHYQNMVTAVNNQMTTGNGPWYLRRPKKIKIDCKQVLLGKSCLSWEPKELVDFMQSNDLKKITVIVPVELNDKNKLFWVSAETEEQLSIKYHNSGELTILNKELWSLIMTGTPLQVGSHYLVSHSNNSVLGHSSVNLMLCPSAEVLPLYIKPLTSTLVYRTVKFRMPKLSNWRELVKHNHYLSYKEIQVSEKLYRALSLRMLREGTTLDDLLAYARTYSHTVAYSATSAGQVNQETISSLMEACACVYFEQTRKNKNVVELSELLGTLETGKLTTDGLFKHASYLFKMAGYEIYKWLGIDFKFQDLLDLVAQLFGKAPNSYLQILQNLRCVRITKEERCDVTIKLIKLNTHCTIVQENDKQRAVEHTADKTVEVMQALYHSLTANIGNMHTFESPRQLEEPTDALSWNCWKLEQFEGKPLKPALAAVREESASKFGIVATHEVHDKILVSMKSPIEIRDDREILFQLEAPLRKQVLENLEMKQKNLFGWVVTEQYLKTLIEEIKWMWPEKCESIEGKTIIMSTIGSRGDTEPYVGMCQMLKLMGADVTIMCNKDLENYVKSKDIKVWTYNVTSDEIISSVISMMNSMYNPVKMVVSAKRMLDAFSKVFQKPDVPYPCEFLKADLVLETPFTFVASQLSTKFKVPYMYSTPYPWELQAGMDISGKKMDLSNIMAEVLGKLPIAKKMDEWRENVLKLSDQCGDWKRFVALPMLYTHSDLIRWWNISSQSKCIGYVNTVEKVVTERERKLIKQASRLITVAICFGSMTGEERMNLTIQTCRALSNTVCNVLIVDSNFDHSEFSKQTANVYTGHCIVLTSINYSVLFPVVDVVLTHGGSGTLHNALRHGCIPVIHPHLGDQYLWKHTVQQLNLGMDTSTFFESLSNGGLAEVLKLRPHVEQFAELMSEETAALHLVYNFDELLSSATSRLMSAIKGGPLNTQDLQVDTSNRINRLVRMEPDTTGSSDVDDEGSSEGESTSGDSSLDPGEPSINEETTPHNESKSKDQESKGTNSESSKFRVKTIHIQSSRAKQSKNRERIRPNNLLTQLLKYKEPLITDPKQLIKHRKTMEKKFKDMDIKYKLNDKGQIIPTDTYNRVVYRKKLKEQRHQLEKEKPNIEDSGSSECDSDEQSLINAVVSYYNETSEESSDKETGTSPGEHDADLSSDSNVKQTDNETVNDEEEQSENDRATGESKLVELDSEQDHMPVVSTQNATVEPDMLIHINKDQDEEVKVMWPELKLFTSGSIAANYAPQYTSFTNKSKVLYNPTTDKECVRLCVQELAKLQHMDENIVAQTLDEIYCYMGIGRSPNLAQLIMISYLVLGEVLIVNNDGEVITTTARTDWKAGDLALSAKHKGGVGHCTVIKLMADPDPYWLPDESLELPYSSKDLEMLRQQFTPYPNLTDFTFNHLLKDRQVAPISNLDLTYNFDELKEKLTFKNLHHIISRRKRPIKMVKAIKRCSDLCISDSANLTEGRVVVVLSRESWLTGVVYHTNSEERIALPTDQASFPKYVLVVETSMVLLKQSTPKRNPLVKLRTFTSAGVTALNNLTYNASRQWDESGLVKGVGDKSCEYLLVYHYDNRAHHKFDDKDLMEHYGPSKTMGLGFDLDQTLWNRIMQRESSVRNAVHLGRPGLCLETKSINHYNAWLTILNIISGMVVDGSNIFIPDKNTTQYERDCIEALAKLSNHVNGTKEPDESLHSVCSQWTDWEPIRVAGGLDKGDLKNSTGIDEQRIELRLISSPAKAYNLVSVFSSNKLETPTKNTIFVTKLMIVLEWRFKPTIGGGEDEQLFWKSLNEHDHAKGVNRWWDIPTSKPKTKFNEAKFSQLSTTALEHADPGSTVKEVELISTIIYPNVALEGTEWMPMVAPAQWPKFLDEEPGTTEDVDLNTMIMWTDLDLSDWNEKYGPTNDVIVKSRIPATELVETKKTFLTEYPMYSRPVLTKAANQEFNAVTGRLCKVETYRKKNYNLISELTEFRNAYFDQDKLNELLPKYQEDKLTFNDGKVLDWLRDRPDSNKVAQELEEILSEGLEIRRLNTMNVHLKLESLLKSEPASNMRQVKARVLVWQCKGYCAVFSHIFKDLKQRLKSLLRPAVLYTDGLRADELANRVRLETEVNWFLENDLAQQDRQTDHEIIQFEMQVYKLLGMKEETVQLWHKCHFDWFYKGASVKGYRDSMRLTGQATTALGNAITNMLVHRSLVQRLGTNMSLFLILGDDGLFFLKDRVDTQKLNNQLKVNHNMMCKPQISQNFGTFCCMLATKSECGCTLGPDFVRLKRRFEVTNGVSEVNDTNLMARIMSYCMMLGDLPEVENVISTHNLPISPLRWYDYEATVTGVALKYGITTFEVTDNIKELCKMMKQPKLYDIKVLHWTEKW